MCVSFFPPYFSSLSSAFSPKFTDLNQHTHTQVHPDTGLIDFEDLQRLVDLFKPHLIICGGSCYPREWDYARFRKIADSCSAYLMCDMAHIR